jgi:hypothetical protein
MPVLITAGLSSEAYRLHRLLNVSDAIFADETPLPAIPGIRNIILPAYNSASFVHEVLKACLDHGITRIYPLKPGEVIELSHARALFSEFNVALVIPSADWLKSNVPAGLQIKTNSVSVLENGLLIAGAALPGHLPVQHETGVFCWATSDQKVEYSLYLVHDEGI